MDCVTILAQAVETVEQAPQPSEWTIIPIDLMWKQITLLGKLEAFTFISFGVVCLFYGWRVFKILTIISFALFGLFIGLKTNELLVGGNAIWLGIIGAALFAFFSIPLMRWAVCILGAVAGGILTAGLWLTCELPEQYFWAGGLIGIVAGGMISFIIFKIAVMLFTSLGGGALIVTGVLSLLYQYESIQEPPTENIKELFFNQNWFVPVLLLIPTAIGIIVQNKFVKGAKDWRV